MRRPLGKQPFITDNVPSFVANVMIPKGVDRATFIQHCYNSGTVMVVGADYQREFDVYVDKEVLKCIVFPPASHITGSSVLCITDRIDGTSKVVAVFLDKNTQKEIYEENQYRILRAGADTFVDFDIKGASGEWFLCSKSIGNGSKSVVKLLNPQNKALLEVLIQGGLDLTVDDFLRTHIQKELTVTVEDVTNSKNKKTEIKYVLGEGFTYTDEFGNNLKIEKTGFTASNKTGETFEMTSRGFVMSNKKANLKKILLNFLNAFENQIVLTPTGPGVLNPGGIALVEQIKISVNNLFK